MTMNERSGRRSLIYSGWHRPPNLARCLEPVFAHIDDHHERHRQAMIAATGCTMIDVDGLEYCHRCREPLALIETQEGDRPPKAAPVLTKLAERALVPAFSVSYLVDTASIAALRVSQLYPTGGLIDQRETAHDYAAFILGLHQGHRCLP